MKVEEFYENFTDVNNNNRKGKSARELLYQMMEEYADHKQLNIGIVSNRLLKKHLAKAEKALEDIVRWDDEMEDKYSDQGHRANLALNEIKKLHGF